MVVVGLWIDDRVEMANTHSPFRLKPNEPVNWARNVVYEAS